MPSMLDIPKDPKKIRARIRSCERKLRKEKQDYGDYQDGAGACTLLDDHGCVRLGVHMGSRRCGHVTVTPRHCA